MALTSVDDILEAEGQNDPASVLAAQGWPVRAGGWVLHTRMHVCMRVHLCMHLHVCTRASPQCRQPRGGPLSAWVAAGRGGEQTGGRLTVLQAPN